MPSAARVRPHLLRGYRLAVLVLVFLVVHGHRQELRSAAAQPIGIREVQVLLPDAVDLVPAPAPRSGVHVVDADGRVLGRAVKTSPGADALVGYAGPTDCLVVLDDADRVVGVKIRSSGDTPGHVADVIGDGEFLRGFKGRTWDEVAAMDPARVDGVSGASRTSRCIAASIAWRFSPEGTTVATAPLCFGLHDVALLLIAGGGLFLLRRTGRRQTLRRVFQVVVFVYLGLLSGELLALSLAGGWMAAGIPWRAAPGLVALFAAALLVPWASGKPVYCAHVCPHGAAQEWLGRTRRRKLVLPAALRWGLRAVPVLLLAIGLLVVVIELPLDLASLEAFDAYVLPGAGLAALVIAGAGLFAAPWVPMAYCRYGCPTGALLAFMRGHGAADRFGMRDVLAASFLGVAVLLTVGHARLDDLLLALPVL